MALIETEALRHTYRIGGEPVRALDGVSLKVGRGEFVAVMGPSGSGKSTFLHLLGCLDTPTAGRYRLDGTDVAGLGRDALAAIRREKLGFVFQNFSLLPRTTALDNVELPLLYIRVPAGERRRRAEARLAELGLADRAHHHPSQLSGGQQQRVAIARALANDPVLLLADEPTGALDSETSREIMSVFQRLNREKELTVVLVTHEPSVAACAGRVILFRDGRVVGDERTPRREAGRPVRPTPPLASEPASSDRPGAVEQVRGALEAAQFHRTFPGSLPILHHVLTGEPTRVPERGVEDGAGPAWMPERRAASFAEVRRRPAGWLLAGCGLLLAIGGGAAFWPYAAYVGAPNATVDPREVRRPAPEPAESPAELMETGAAAPSPTAALKPGAAEAAMAVGPAIADTGAEPVPPVSDTGSLLPPEAAPSTGRERTSAAAEPPLQPSPEPSPTSSAHEATVAAAPTGRRAVPEPAREHAEATASRSVETPPGAADLREVEQEPGPARGLPSLARAPAGEPNAIAVPLAPAPADAPLPAADPAVVAEPPTASWEAGLAATPAPRLPHDEPDGDETGPTAAPAPAEAAGGTRVQSADPVLLAPVAVAPALPAATLAVLLRRGDAMLALGDVLAARLLYGRAAAAGSGQAATALGTTYDPEVLTRLGVRGIAGDPAAAARWYRTALALGDGKAGPLLEQLQGQHP